MYFIYPATVTETCDKRIVPAVAKCIERFFLLQLEDAIASGVLPLSRKYDGKNYGALLLECVKNYNQKQCLIENKILMEAMTPVEIENELTRLESDIEKQEPNELQRRLSAVDTISSEIRRLDDSRGGVISKQEKAELRYRADSVRRAINDMLNHKQKTDEYERRQPTTGGSYMPLDSKIDIVPTTGTVDTTILYKGGPLDGKLQEYVRVNISVKVIPTIVKNFRSLEKDLLDDYFSNKNEAYYKSKGRNIARKCYNLLRHLPFGIGDAIWKTGMIIAGEDVNAESRKDIIYNTQGFVNAAAFHRTGSSPNNYNYTSNIVIFNKDDLSDPDDQNIFFNRNAMVRLFKMGWSTFCMLDPVEEIAYFISSLDGGYVHMLPYRYMMESVGSRAYYGTESKLKDAAKPFLIKRGNFSNFAKLTVKR